MRYYKILPLVHYQFNFIMKRAELFTEYINIMGEAIPEFILRKKFSWLYSKNMTNNYHDVCDVDFDVIILGTGLTQCILAG